MTGGTPVCELDGDDVMQLISVANTLRGVSLDPNVPQDVKLHLLKQAEIIDNITEPEEKE